MKATDFFDDQDFIKSSDVTKPLKVSVLGVTTKELGGKKKLVLQLSNGKWLPLNKTNIQTLIDMFGTETDDWTNQKLTLIKVKVEYMGRPVDGVRIGE